MASILDRMRNIKALSDAGYPWMEWAVQQDRYTERDYYYSGDVFAELSNTEDPEGPLQYPLKINIFRGVTETIAHALWGTFDDGEIVSFRVMPKKHGPEVSETAKEMADYAQRLINEIWEDNGRDILLAQASIAQAKEGGVFFRSTWDPLMGRVQLEALAASTVFPVWSARNVDDLLAVLVAYESSEKAVELQYGIPRSTLRPKTSLSGTVLVMEEWTAAQHRIWVEDRIVKDTPNPYGFIPLVYVPFKRELATFYGDAPADVLMGIQDEVNKRLADIGDYLNYNAHPIRWIRDFRGDPDEDLPVGPDVLWDLGRSLTQIDRPEVGTLQANPVPPGTYEYLGVVQGYSMDVTHTPPVVFGRDEGSQRSSATLIVRMWPLVQAIKFSRVFWGHGLKRVNDQIFRIVSMYGRPTSKIVGLSTQPIWHSLIPRARTELVDEVIQLSGGNLIAPRTALERLGVEDPDAEIEGIKEWMDYASEKNMSMQTSFSKRSVSSV